MSEPAVHQRRIAGESNGGPGPKNTALGPEPATRACGRVHLLIVRTACVSRRREMKAKRISALVGALVLLAATTSAQSQFPTVGMPEQPVVVRTAAATVKVSAIRGLVYPWAL